MSRDDSGVIDLFAIQAEAQARSAARVTPEPPLSAPPPAFVTDLSSPAWGDPDELALTRRRDPKKLAFAGAGAAVVIGLLAVLASAFGSSEPDTKAAVRDVKSTTAVAAAPPPVVTSLPAPAKPAANETAVAVKTPPPPTTGTPVRPAAPKVAAKPSGKAAPAHGSARKASSGGPKLMKVQSGGVPNDAAH